MTEDDLEQIAIEWFQELGYEYAKGEEISPGGLHPERAHYADIYLDGRLFDAMSKLNPDYSVEEIQSAVARLTQYANNDQVEGNRTLYTWLRDGVPTEVVIESHKREVLLAIFDWDVPNNNDWLIVNQFAVKGIHPHPLRPDMIVFVNGIPLSVIELKNPADESADVYAAYNQIQNYKNDIPQLFLPNVANVISDGTVARVGSLTSNEEWFTPWRVAEGIENTFQHLELEVMIKGLFDRANFLEYMKHFVAFQNTGKGYVKMTAGYHQFYGVRKAVEKALDAALHVKDGRGGVLWFTQGSGKSLFALFYAAMLKEMPELENPTIVVVTDRNNLDGQLYETFANCSIPMRSTPYQADDKADLRALLADKPAGGVFFTTIHKFAPAANNLPIQVLSKRHNIIVICDEAHRTQYGFQAKVDPKTGQIKYGLAKYMREALPNAVYLGMTGTPVSDEEKDTQDVFGTYVDIYDVMSSQEDKTTVPILYEGRVIDIKINDPELLKALDDELDDLTELDDQAERDGTISRLTRLESIHMADNRLDILVDDLIKHWEMRLEVLDGKAMVVALSRKLAAIIYTKIIERRPEWHSDDLNQGVVKVVMSSSSSDIPEMRMHKTTSQQRKTLEKRLKDPEDPLKIVIVRDMWLTGFDAPCLHTLYVDKRMDGHNLMQAIARVNRVWKDKPGGLIVDYIGIGEELKKAIKTYTNATGGSRGKPVEMIEQSLVILKDTLDVIRKKLSGVDYSGFSTSPKNALNLLPKVMDYISGLTTDADKKGRNKGVKDYLDLVMRLTKAQALAGTHPEALIYREEIAFLQAVKASFVKHTTAGGGSMKSKVERDEAMRQLVSKGILVEGVSDLYETLGLDKPDISLLDEKFLSQLASIKTKNLALELLHKLLKGGIQSRSRLNATQGHKFSKKLEEAINKYHNRALTTLQVIKELLDIAREFNDEKPPEDLSADEFAFYQALAENQSAVDILGDPILKELAHELTEKMRKSATIDWQKRETARAKMRMLIKILLTKYRYPPDKQPDAVERVVEQAELFADEWGME